MKIYVIILMLFSTLLIAEIEVDVVSAASNKNCGGVNCRNDQACIRAEHRCEYICSKKHPKGVCKQEEMACDKGKCKPVCGSMNPNGACKDPVYLCVEGECEDNSCSSDRPNGLCPEIHVCENGACVNNKCSKDRPNGYCDDGRECNSGKCEEIGGCNYNRRGLGYLYFFLFLMFYTLLRKIVKER